MPLYLPLALSLAHSLSLLLPLSPPPSTIPTPKPSPRRGVRPELPDGGDWRDSTTAGLAKLIEHCWKTEHEGRPSFGGAEGVVATLTTIEGRMLKKDEDATVEALQP